MPLHGDGPATVVRPRCSSRSEPSPRRSSCCDHAGVGALRRQRRGRSSATAPSSPWCASRTGTTTPCTPGSTAALVGRDAHVKHVVVTFGGNLVRLHTTRRYAGPGGEAELFGLYFADAGQHLEHRLFVDHNAPHSRANVDYQRRAAGRGAHTVWIGDVLIRKVAEGTDTYELNRNLVLTDGCPRRLGAQPGDRDRRDRGRRARLDDRPLRRRAAVLPAVAAASPRTRPAGWSCAASSPTSSARSACPRSRSGCWRPSIELERGSGGSPMRARRHRRLSRACALADVPAEHAPRGRRRRREVAVVRSGGQVLAIPDVCSPRRRPAVRRRRRRTARSSAGCTARASTCAPATRPACRPPSPCRSTRSASTATTCSSTSTPVNQEH